MLVQHLADLGSRGVRHSGVVLDLVGDVDLPARPAPLQKEDVQPGATSIDGRGHARRACANDNELTLFHNFIDSLKVND